MSNTPMYDGLPVAGYDHAEKKTNAINENKQIEEYVLRHVDRFVRNADSGEIDQRAVALARTHIQDAFMWLNRAISRPPRIIGPLSLPEA